MEFNWTDPRKNKRVDSVMMAKAEASRVKRLTSVKSTVSNQLNPAVEHKLKTMKKKKTAEAHDERPSSRLHQREFDLGGGNNNNDGHSSNSGSGHGLRATGSASAATGSNNHSFYNEFLPQAARPKSIFDSFDVHAAADGLFHPASNVQAFAEHDARYPAAAKDRDSGRRTATTSSKGSERRLPPLSRGYSDRSERLASRSESRLPTAASSSSGSLSSASSSRGLSGLGGNRSDGDLHAPRRVGIVPSSADRNAMELLEELEHDDHDHSDDDDDNYPMDEEHEPHAPSPKHSLKTASATASALSTSNNNHDSEHHRDGVVPPLELDLAHKFAKLKSMIKSNGEKEEESKAPRGPEIDEDGDAKAVPETKSKTAAGRKEAPAAKPVKANDKSSSGGVVKRQPATTASADGDTAASSSSGPIVVARKPRTKTTIATSEVKARNGVSLSDLKEEHRAALAMLQELGGPLEDQEDAARGGVAKKASRHARVAAASSKESSMGGAASKATATKSSSSDDRAAPIRPAGSADRSSRLVDKLRARIPSAGRDKPDTAPPSESDALQGHAVVSAALDAARQALASGEAMLARRDDEAAEHSHQQDVEANEQLWKRYGGDEQEEEDEEEDPSAELYDDEGFEG